jgi:uncharacterized RDD family membrane protein YckC
MTFASRLGVREAQFILDICILVARHSIFGAFSFALFPIGPLLWNAF